MQGRRRRRWYPSAIRTGLWMADLGHQHIGHPVGHRPHAFADLRASLQTTRQTDIDVAILIGFDPARVLHFALGQHRARLHRGVDFITCPVKEPGIDERHPRFRRAYTLLEVGTRAPFLVHDTQLYGIGRQPQSTLNMGENLVGKGDFFRPVHLRLHDIDAARHRIAAVARQIVHRNHRGDHRVHQPFADLQTVAVQHCRVRHQMPHIADQHQCAAFHDHLAAARTMVNPVRIHLAGQALAALLKGLFQITAHQAQPVGIGPDFVFRIYRSNRIFTVHDCGQGRLQNHV